MKPRQPETTDQDDLFRHRLDNLISLKYPLVRLAKRIGWDALNQWQGEYNAKRRTGQQCRKR